MKKRLENGTIYEVSEPEFIGTMPVRSELVFMPEEEVRPSAAEEEFAEHGSIALRFSAPTDYDGDNLLDRYIKLEVGGSILVRAKMGGWYMPDLRKDKHGWYVCVGQDYTRLDVVLDDARGCWVVKELV